MILSKNHDAQSFSPELSCHTLIKLRGPRDVLVDRIK